MNTINIMNIVSLIARVHKFYNLRILVIQFCQVLNLQVIRLNSHIA